jgi:NAD(P)-dependent dehydrogenase (short-subunit alcohol dehydrogenase family)
MAVTLKPLNQQVIVITGATSGIGLTTARRASEKGARLVLAARTEQDLRELEGEIGAGGGQSVTVVADVANEDDVRRIAEAAVARFGGFDTWVNNAGVSIWGRLEDASMEDNRRLFDTNFWGLVHGSFAAARHLRTRGGAIINLGSAASDRTFPLQGMYCASKHAVKGFTDSLRLELEEEGAPVSVTLIKPAGIDTPFIGHAKNNMAEEPKLPPPVYPPEEVAHAILQAATRPIRDVYVGGASKVLSTMGKLAPRVTDKYMEAVMFDQQKRDEPARPRVDALHRPGGGTGLHERGDQPGHVMGSSFYTRASLHPVVTGVVLGVAGATLAGLLRQRSGQRSLGLERRWRGVGERERPQLTAVVAVVSASEQELSYPPEGAG